MAKEPGHMTVKGKFPVCPKCGRNYSWHTYDGWKYRNRYVRTGEHGVPLFLEFKNGDGTLCENVFCICQTESNAVNHPRGEPQW